ncbi:hypothetical protein DFH08DRAFT_820245 [Mycena albidolilacea]|uniref:Uncharacterized protein n=1 Tax=Mycena albidolilacea TaxID=1033008 RepID=A0AAD6ZC66_9AGAR|nr:hypothetical protein DFH08DRAFT_820245 [Mycena albidolilacea]
MLSLDNLLLLSTFCSPLPSLLWFEIPVINCPTLSWSEAHSNFSLSLSCLTLSSPRISETAVIVEKQQTRVQPPYKSTHTTLQFLGPPTFNFTFAPNSTKPTRISSQFGIHQVRPETQHFDPIVGTPHCSTAYLGDHRLRHTSPAELQTLVAEMEPLRHKINQFITENIAGNSEPATRSKQQEEAKKIELLDEHGRLLQGIIFGFTCIKFVPRRSRENGDEGAEAYMRERGRVPVGAGAQSEATRKSARAPRSSWASYTDRAAALWIGALKRERGAAARWGRGRLERMRPELGKSGGGGERQGLREGERENSTGKQGIEGVVDGVGKSEEGAGDRGRARVGVARARAASNAEEGRRRDGRTGGLLRLKWDSRRRQSRVEHPPEIALVNANSKARLYGARSCDEARAVCERGGDCAGVWKREEGRNK